MPDEPENVNNPLNVDDPAAFVRHFEHRVTATVELAYDQGDKAVPELAPGDPTTNFTFQTNVASYFEYKDRAWVVSWYYNEKDEVARGQRAFLLYFPPPREMGDKMCVLLRNKFNVPEEHLERLVAEQAPVFVWVDPGEMRTYLRLTLDTPPEGMLESEDAPEPYLDWLGAKADLGLLMQVPFGVSIHTSDEQMIRANVAEDKLDADSQEFWDEIERNLAIIEANALQLLREAGLYVQDEGHDGNDSRCASLYIAAQPLGEPETPEQIKLVKAILAWSDGDLPSTTSGTFDSCFGHGATIKLFEGTTDLGKYIDVTFEFHGTTALAEWAKLNLVESTGDPDDPEAFVKNFQPRFRANLVIDYCPAVTGKPNSVYKNVDALDLIRFKVAPEIRRLAQELRSREAIKVKNAYRLRLNAPERDAITHSWLEKTVPPEELANILDPGNSANLWLYFTKEEFYNFVQLVWPKIKLREDLEDPDVDSPESVMRFDPLDVLVKAGFHRNASCEVYKDWPVDLAGSVYLYAIDYPADPVAVSFYVRFGEDVTHSDVVAHPLHVWSDWMNVLIPRLEQFMAGRKGDPKAVALELHAFIDRTATELGTAALANQKRPTVEGLAEPRRQESVDVDQPAPEQYLAQIHDVEEVVRDIQAYGLFVNSIRQWGRWLILNGGTFHNTEDNTEAGCRQNIEQFLQKLGITQHHLKLGTVTMQSHIWFQLAIPKSQITPESWQPYRRNTTGWPAEPYDTWLPESENLDDPVSNINRAADALDVPATMHRLGFEDLYAKGSTNGPAWGWQEGNKKIVVFPTANAFEYEITILTRPAPKVQVGRGRRWAQWSDVGRVKCNAADLEHTIEAMRRGQVVEGIADPDAPELNIERHTAALDLPALMQRLAFKEVPVRHRNFSYWEKVIGPVVWTVRPNKDGTVDVHKGAAFGTPQGWIDSWAGTYRVSELEKRLQGAGFNDPVATVEALTDPDAPELNVNRHIASMEPGPILTELGFSDRWPSWKCSDPEYMWWEKFDHKTGFEWTVIRKSDEEPQLMEVSIYRMLKIRNQAFHDWKQIGGFNCHVGDLKKKLQRAFQMQWYVPGDDRVWGQNVRALDVQEALDEPDDPTANVERFAQHVEKTRQELLDTTINSALADFDNTIEMRGIDDLKRADEKVAEVVNFWAEQAGYENGSDDYDHLMSAVNTRCGEMFPTPDSMFESKDEENWQEILMVLVGNGRLTPRAAERYKRAQNAESNARLLELFLELDELSQLPETPENNVRFDELLGQMVNVVTVANMRYGSALRDLARTVKVDENDEVNPEAFVKSQPLEVLARATSAATNINDTIRFDASKWFEQATLEDLMMLAKGGMYGPFNRCHSADLVARHFIHAEHDGYNPELAALHDRAEKLNVFISEADAKRWVEFNRPDWFANLWPADVVIEAQREVVDYPAVYVGGRIFIGPSHYHIVTHLEQHQLPLTDALHGWWTSRRRFLASDMDVNELIALDPRFGQATEDEPGVKGETLPKARQIQGVREVHEAIKENAEVDPQQFINATFSVPDLLKRLRFEKNGIEWSKVYRRPAPHSELMLVISRRGHGNVTDDAHTLYDLSLYTDKGKRWEPFMHVWGRRILQLEPTIRDVEKHIRGDTLDEIVYL